MIIFCKIHLVSGTSLAYDNGVSKELLQLQAHPGVIHNIPTSFTGNPGPIFSYSCSDSLDKLSLSFSLRSQPNPVSHQVKFILDNVSHISNCIRIQITNRVIFTSSSIPFQLIFNTIINKPVLKFSILLTNSLFLHWLPKLQIIFLILSSTSHLSAAPKCISFLDVCGHSCPTSITSFCQGLCLSLP